MNSEIFFKFLPDKFSIFWECFCTRSRNSAVSSPNTACGLHNPKYRVEEANTTNAYLAASSFPVSLSSPRLLSFRWPRRAKILGNEVYVAVAVTYSVCVSFAITARNSSSRLDWVVSSSLSRHILIRPCESPVASV